MLWTHATSPARRKCGSRHHPTRVIPRERRITDVGMHRGATRDRRACTMPACPNFRSRGAAQTGRWHARGNAVGGDPASYGTRRMPADPNHSTALHPFCAGRPSTAEFTLSEA